MAPEDCTRNEISAKCERRCACKYSQESELETLLGLKLAVAEGGIDCETVVLAGCAATIATRADTMESIDSILTSSASDGQA